MRAEALTEEGVAAFLAYCRKHRAEVDDSYLSDDELQFFEPNEEHPTYVLTGSQGEVIGAASLVIDDYHRRGRSARFRILHSESGCIEDYRSLMQAVLRHGDGLDAFFTFVPATNMSLTRLIEKLGFSVERYSFVLVRMKELRACISRKASKKL